MKFSLAAATFLATISHVLAYPTMPQTLEKRYAPGWCGLHFIDYQIPSGDSQYYTAVGIYDADGSLIGQVGDPANAGGDRVPAISPLDIDSQLPAVLIYARPGPGCSGYGFEECDVNDPDDAPITFQYNGATWLSSDSVCSTGGFQNGYRQGDCGFTC